MKRSVCEIAAFALPMRAIAAGPPPASSGERSLDFALQFAKTKTVFAHANVASVDTTVERIGMG